jgi:hypothetical protein
VAPFTPFGNRNRRYSGEVLAVLGAKMKVVVALFELEWEFAESLLDFIEISLRDLTELPPLGCNREGKPQSKTARRVSIGMTTES